METVKVIHGANDDVFDRIAGVTVKQVHCNLVDAFNLRPDTLAFINGTQVGPSYRLRPNDTLEFCQQFGLKGIDRLMTRHQIQAEYGFTDEIWDQFSTDVIQFAANSEGSPIYLETTIDDWLARRATGYDKGAIFKEIATSLSRIADWKSESREQVTDHSGKFCDQALVSEIRRIADHFDPPNLEVVGTPYIAERLGVTPKWVGDLVRKGEIPKSCICPKSGQGNYWRFWKKQIDKWIEER